MRIIATLAALLLAPAALAQPAAGIDRDAIDAAVRPQDDLFRHVNGTWLATFEIPPDRSSYGSFIGLRDQAQRGVRAIIEEAAAGGFAGVVVVGAAAG